MSILRRIFPFLLTTALLCACVQMPNTPQDVLPAPTPQSTAVPTATPETSQYELSTRLRSGAVLSK